mmetsp:Transcript_39409/g.92046  ORF Transcript_39409/g.92046 Transcript_39409/m.92046 type:complete len:205 (+) Transcript_39409:774-1388(+)
MNWAQPVIVPPVPTPPTKISSFPSQSFHISGPVVSLWIFGLSGLLNCCSIKPFSPKPLAISSALAIAPPIPFADRVKTSSAPNALSRTRRSILMDSGIVKINLYPFEAATMARPMPVFPDVGSTRVVFPGEISPRSSACVTIESAIRSFTELPGLADSILQIISALQESPVIFEESLTKGVFPIKSRMELMIKFPSQTHFAILG